MTIGSYQIDSVLGMGAETEVLAAFAAGGRRVVVKAFGRREPAQAMARVAARDHEVRAMRRAGPVGVPSILGEGDDETRGPYFAMPHIEGRSLRALAGAGPMLPEHAVVLLLPAIRTLATMHERGLAHGDVKPEHVLATPSGDVWLLDFGLAFELGAPSEQASVSGTVGYIAPEILEGLPRSSAVDVFALGVTLHELIAGARPFEQTPDGRYEGARTPLDAVDPRVPHELAELVASCLATSPRDRPSCVAVVASLEALVAPLGAELDALRGALVGAATDTDSRSLAEAESARRIAASLVRQAHAAIDDEDAFTATRRLDRALACVPDDADALAALERAMRPPRVSRRTRRRMGLVVVGVVLLGVLLASIDALVPRVRGPAADTTESARVAPRRITPLASLVPGFEPLPPERLPNATLLQGRTRERETLRALDARLRNTPNDRVARRRRAALRLELGRVRDAHADLATLVAADPRDVHALRALTALYDRLGESARTEPLLARIVELRPRDADAWTDLSIAGGESARAVAALERAYAIASRSPRVNARRCALGVHARLPDALARCEAAARRSPRNPFVLADLSAAHELEHDLAGAHAALVRALGERPEDVGFAWRLEAIERALGDEEAAARTRAEACALEPDARCSP